MKYVIILLLIFTSCNKAERTFDPELEPVKLYPPDTEIQDSSLIDFLEDIKLAVQDKDTSFIIDHLDENIHLSFGGHVGIEDFRDLWNIDVPESKFWLTIQQILDLKGTYRDSIYTSPYVFSNWPNVDPFDHAAIIAENVDLYESPQVDSRVITKLSYDVVEIDDNKSMPEYGTPISERENPLGGKDWYYIMTLDNKYEGYVYWMYIRSPISYRMKIKYKTDRWKIITFIAGD